MAAGVSAQQDASRRTDYLIVTVMLKVSAGGTFFSHWRA
jgi:hypothetical protein